MEVKKYVLLCLLALVGVSLRAQQQPRDTLRNIFHERDSIAMSDTLRTVEVTRNGGLPISVSPFWKQAMLMGSKRFSDYIPETVTDKIMHPFAIKDRKRERHARKMRRILRDYDLLKTPNEVLKEALRAEGIDPDLLQPPTEKPAAP
ncbi:MAG: hypothetical protein HUK02_03170 [Bacteroidaceae bacterium]|nr:hypothetical protein [Bacteroidaceae bacterium]